MTRQARAEQTRRTIIDAALRLFAEQGYEATTMRAIAAAAGVSLGNAYYYFSSKEHLIQGFYDQAAARQAEMLPTVLAGKRTLEARLTTYLDAWFAEMSTYHAFAGSFFRNAADPASPLSPFSPESGPAREAAIAMMRAVIEGSDAKAPKAVAADLPELLWLYHMGCVLFWVHDRSDGAAATRYLVHRTAPLVVRAVELAKLPVLRGIVSDLTGLMADLKGMVGAQTTPG